MLVPLSGLTAPELRADEAPVFLPARPRPETPVRPSQRQTWSQAGAGRLQRRGSAAIWLASKGPAGNGSRRVGRGTRARCHPRRGGGRRDRGQDQLVRAMRQGPVHPRRPRPGRPGSAHRLAPPTRGPETGPRSAAGRRSSTSATPRPGPTPPSADDLAQFRLTSFRDGAARTRASPRCPGGRPAGLTAGERGAFTALR